MVEKVALVALDGTAVGNVALPAEDEETLVTAEEVVTDGMGVIIEGRKDTCTAARYC